MSDFEDKQRLFRLIKRVGSETESGGRGAGMTALEKKGQALDGNVPLLELEDQDDDLLLVEVGVLNIILNTSLHWLCTVFPSCK